jgi:hypothetical protein
LIAIWYELSCTSCKYACMRAKVFQMMFESFIFICKLPNLSTTSYVFQANFLQSWMKQTIIVSKTESIYLPDEYM